MPLAAIAVAVLVALLVWWLSTGLILILDGMDRRTFPRSMLGATVVLAIALYGVARYRDDTSAAGAYAGFACAIAVWGWIEMSFLMGYLTGPRKLACSLGCTGWRHFLHAIQAILYHEVTILTLAAATFALGGHGANHVAFGSLAILWGMRASAKLNLFFGVRNLSEELLPSELVYLKSFFRKRPMNFLFPFSVTGGVVLATLLIQKILAPGASEFDITGGSLLATLAVLGILEHWMLVLPFPTTALWSWGLRSREALEFREPRS
jgi:putative photosynthetic complex assembly protein 2